MVSFSDVSQFLFFFCVLPSNVLVIVGGSKSTSKVVEVGSADTATPKWVRLVEVDSFFMTVTRTSHVFVELLPLPGTGEAT